MAQKEIFHFWIFPIHTSLEIHFHIHLKISSGSRCAFVANVLDRKIVVSDFESQLLYIHSRTYTFGKGMKTIYLSYELNSTTTILLQRWLQH